jgi:hypothetical protein
MDALTLSQDRLRPRASVPYSLSAVLFLPGLIPFVNEEDFRSPLLLLLASRHKPIRFGVDLDCNPPLNAEVSAWLFFLLSKILST